MGHPLAVFNAQNIKSFSLYKSILTNIFISLWLTCEVDYIYNWKTYNNNYKNNTLCQSIN